MFKQFTPYAFTGPLGSDRERTAFVPCGSSQASSIGYVDHSNGEPFVAGIELVTLERKTVPSDVVKREANKRADVIEANTGRRPKGKHFKEIKEEVTHEMLAKAFPKRKTVPVLWLANYVLIGTTTSADLDLITTLLVEGQGEGFRLDYVKTPTEPSVAMTQWATAGHSREFAVGSDLAVLTGTGKATFKTLSVQTPEVKAALADGGTVTSLALTSLRGLSFTLTELLQVKSIKVGGTDGSGDHADASSAECYLFRGELNALLAALLESLDAA